MKGAGLIYKDHLSAAAPQLLKMERSFSGPTGCQLPQMSAVAAHFYWMSRVRNMLVTRGVSEHNTARAGLHCVIHSFICCLPHISPQRRKNMKIPADPWTTTHLLASQLRSWRRCWSFTPSVCEGRTPSWTNPGTDRQYLERTNTETLLVRAKLTQAKVPDLGNLLTERWQQQW